MKIMLGVLAVLLTLSLTADPAAAQGRDHRRGVDHGRHPGWHGEIRSFHERDLGRWSGGRWHHGRHAGRFGWWWIVGGVWYFYPAPVYPYPDPYLPPLVLAPPAAPATQYWYYCTNPPGYYPYVPRCAGRWRPVPAQP